MGIPPITKNIDSLIVPPDQVEADYCWATNRPQAGSIIRAELLAQQGIGDTVNKLESFTPSNRGSREKPLVMRYPLDIDSGQLPHVMQFKVFWRWQNTDFVEKASKLVSESESLLADLENVTNKINEDNYDTESLINILGNDEFVFNPDSPDNLVRNLTGYSNYYSDPSKNQELADMLMDPSRREEAKLMLEKNRANAVNRVQSIGADFGSGQRGLTSGLSGGTIAPGVTFTSVDLVKDNDVLSNRFNKVLSQGVMGDVKNKVNSWLSNLKMQIRDPQYDQMVSIYLPTCTRINGEDTFSYSDANMALATGALAQVNALASAWKSGNGFMDTAGKVMEAGSQTAVAAAQNVASESIAGVIPALTGLAVNPRLEKMFKEKEIRSFQFSWDFYPKNQEEVDTLKDIIDTFRYHAHPARSSEGDGAKNEKGESIDPQIMLRVPAEFTVKFLSSSARVSNDGSIVNNGFVENEYIPKISRCALTSISIDYTPQGVFSTFENNSPVAYSITLSFSEIASITREDIKAGY